MSTSRRPETSRVSTLRPGTEGRSRATQPAPVRRVLDGSGQGGGSGRAAERPQRPTIAHADRALVTTCAACRGLDRAFRDRSSSSASSYGRLVPGQEKSKQSEYAGLRGQGQAMRPRIRVWGPRRSRKTASRRGPTKAVGTSERQSCSSCTQQRGAKGRAFSWQSAAGRADPSARPVAGKIPSEP